MTAEEQKKMQALEAENAKLREENSGLQERLLRNLMKVFTKFMIRQKKQ